MDNFQKHPCYAETEKESMLSAIKHLKFEVGFMKKANEQLQAKIDKANKAIRKIKIFAIGDNDGDNIPAILNIVEVETDINESFNSEG